MVMSARTSFESDARVENRMDSELVKGILRVMCRKGVYLTTTRAQKLLYLIERQCVMEHGQRALGLDYRYDRFGMYSPSLNRVLTNLDSERDGLQVKDIVSERGMGRVISCVRSDAREALPLEIEQATASVLAEFGFLNTPALIAVAKGTSPFVYAKKGEFLDWNLLLEERCPSDEVLSDEGRRRLERALKTSAHDGRPVFRGADEVMAYLFP